MKKTFTILKVEPDNAPYIKEIPNTLKACQKEVDGLIQVVYLDDGCLAIMNDEGKLRGMKPNRRIEDDIICGSFFICGESRNGKFISLTEKQI